MSVREKIESLAKYFGSLAFQDDYDYTGAEFGSKTAYAKAERENLQVVLPTDRQLFIDIDNDFAMAVFEKNSKTFWNWYAAEFEGEPKITESKSGGERKHITITLNRPVLPLERLLLQAFLGSDLRREFLGLQRIKHEDPHPTLFLEKKSSSDFVPADVPKTERIEDDIPF